MPMDLVLWVEGILLMYDITYVPYVPCTATYAHGELCKIIDKCIMKTIDRSAMSSDQLHTSIVY
jgi:hypothetical protein